MHTDHAIHAIHAPPQVFKVRSLQACECQLHSRASAAGQIQRNLSLLDIAWPSKHVTLP